MSGPLPLGAGGRRESFWARTEKPSPRPASPCSDPSPRSRPPGTGSPPRPAGVPCPVPASSQGPTSGPSPRSAALAEHTPAQQPWLEAPGLPGTVGLGRPESQDQGLSPGLADGRSVAVGDLRPPRASVSSLVGTTGGFPPSAHARARWWVRGDAPPEPVPGGVGCSAKAVRARSSAHACGRPVGQSTERRDGLPVHRLPTPPSTPRAAQDPTDAAQLAGTLPPSPGKAGAATTDGGPCRSEAARRASSVCQSACEWHLRQAAQRNRKTVKGKQGPRFLHHRDNRKLIAKSRFVQRVWRTSPRALTLGVKVGHVLAAALRPGLHGARPGTQG